MNKILAILLLVMSISGCSDYLDLVPEDDIITIDAIFEKKNTALEYLNTAYEGYRYYMNYKQDPAIFGSDEFMCPQFNRTKSFGTANYYPAFLIAQGLQNSNKPIGQVWGASNEGSGYYSSHWNSIRVCNTFIDNIDNVYNLKDVEKNQYKAEAKVMKAFYLFDLIRHYGPIPVPRENLGVGEDIDEMLLPREHIDTCINYAVKLIDESIHDLLSLNQMEQDRYGCMVKEAAYFLKVKLLQLAASPLFNGNPWYYNFTNIHGEKLFDEESDIEKWNRMALAADEAIDYCSSIGKTIYEGESSHNTPLLNDIFRVKNSVIKGGFSNTECIWGAWTNSIGMSSIIPSFNVDHYNYSANCAGEVSPSMRMIELFYTNNGLPIHEDKYWNYNERYKLGTETNVEYLGVVALSQSTLNLHLKREPRFYANIAFDKYMYNSREQTFMIRPYKDQDFGTTYGSEIADKKINLTGYWAIKRIPESIGLGRNFFENPSFVQFFRLSELYLMQAEAWNEVTGPSQKIYDAIDKVRVKAGIPKIQEAYVTYSKNPSKINYKESMREIIRTEMLIEFAFEGHRFWDTRRWCTAHELMNKPIYGWNVFGDNSDVFYNNFNGPIKVYGGNTFQAPRDYLFPIDAEQLLISNVKQNPNW